MQKSEYSEVDWRFAAKIAHELKSGLVYLQAGFDVLSVEETKNQQIIKRLKQSLAQQIQMLEAMLLAAQNRQTQSSITNINTMVNSVVDDYEVVLGSRQQKISITRKSIPPAYVNPEIARLIFRNLLDNASKDSPKQSRIAIRLKATKDIVQIEVVDEGDGVSGKELKQISDKKRTIHRPMMARADSNGLGLQLAFELADKIGAHLKVKRMNKKTIFSLTLPRAEQLELFPDENA